MFEARAIHSPEVRGTKPTTYNMGVSESYYSEVPVDPPDEHPNVYIDALKRLTFSGGGTYLQDDDEGIASGVRHRRRLPSCKRVRMLFGQPGQDESAGSFGCPTT